MNFETKSDREIELWIANHETKGATSAPLYLALLEERVRRVQITQKLNFEQSLAHLKQTAVEQRCTTYGALATASGVDWKIARHQMNGLNGHLDRLLDICHARDFPLLTAICVNQGGVAAGELGDEALVGFVNGAKRLGVRVDDPRTFHHACRDACWEWGLDQEIK